jgi:hypothetical protein
MIGAGVPMVRPVLRSAIQAAACQAWTEESDLRRRRLDAHGELPYAEGRCY